jgi:hypothetical protein
VFICVHSRLTALSRGLKVSEERIRHASPKEGFDHTEPRSGAIAGFAVGSVVLLVVMILALQSYFNHIWEQAVYEKVLAPPSEQLITLHDRENWNLTHYGYMDKPSGVVRIPLDRATELFEQEAKSGKLFYPAKNTVPKKEEPEAAPAAPDGAPNGAPAGAAPNGAAPAGDKK